MLSPTLYLASQSPRRHELLRQLGIVFEPLDVAIDERWDGHEPARDYVLRLALSKAREGQRQLAATNGLPVLGADTAVVIDDEVLGKPTDKVEALSMLGRLSGRCHHVYSGVALVGEQERVVVSISRVQIRPLSDAERQSYVDTGEPYGKAGAYAIQGLAASFIHHIEGSYSGIMGLPLYETSRLLYEAGVGVLGAPADSQ